MNERMKAPAEREKWKKCGTFWPQTWLPLQNPRDENHVNKDALVQAPSLVHPLLFSSASSRAWGEVEMHSFILLPQFLSCWVEATATPFLCQFFLILRDSPKLEAFSVWASLRGEP